MASNPLLIDNVIERIFRHLNEETLCKLKLVCTLWNREACREIKKRQSVKIKTIEDLENVLQKVSGNLTVSELTVEGLSFSLSNPKFLQLIRKVAKDLTAINLRLAVGVKADTDSIFRILHNRNTQLKTVQVISVKVTNVNAFSVEYVKLLPIRNDGSKDLLTFPSVRHLSISNGYNVPSMEDYSSLLSTICRTFPNLRGLKMLGFAKEKPSNFDQIRMPQLKELRLEMPPKGAIDSLIHGLGDIHIQCLMKLGLNLKLFDLTNLNRKCTTLGVFLETQKESLTQVILEQKSDSLNASETGYLPSDEILHSPFPVEMSKLQYLNVSRSFVDNLQDVFDSIPNAARLYLNFHQGCRSREYALGPSLNVPTKLKDLAINWIDPLSLRRLAPSLKNRITGLEIMDCNDSLLSVIFAELSESLKNLAVTEVTSAGQMTDEGFSGIKQVDLYKALKNLNWTKPDLHALERLRRAPCLGNLKGLQNVSVRFKKPGGINYCSLWGLDKVAGSLKFLSVNMAKPDAEFVQFMKIVVGLNFMGRGATDHFRRMIQVERDEFTWMFVKEGEA